MNHRDGEHGPTHSTSNENSQSIRRDERSQQWYSYGAESSGTMKYTDKEISGENLPALPVR